MEGKAFNLLKGVFSFNGRKGDVTPQTGDYTAAMVGAAPSGFGFGNTLSALYAETGESYEDYCARVEAVYDTMPHNTAMLVWAVPPALLGRSSGIVSILYKYISASGGKIGALKAIANSDILYSGFQMVLLGGVWQPFEWINPPMQLGVEYRTTERYNGKPVYAQIVNCGSMPNNTTKTYELGITGLEGIVSCWVQFANGEDLIPWTSSDLKNTVKLDTVSPWNGGRVSVTTNYDASSSNMWVNVKYTKSV